MQREILDRLLGIGACEDALKWMASQPSWATAWEKCSRGDWMLWLLDRVSRNSAGRRKLVTTACACARLSLPYVLAGEDRPLKAIQTAEAWARHKRMMSLVDVRAAAHAASGCAAYAAYAAASSVGSAGYAAYAAAHAAYAAYAAAHVAYAGCAASVAYAASGCAAYAAYAAADTDVQCVLFKCADIVREHYATPPRLTRRK